MLKYFVVKLKYSSRQDKYKPVEIVQMFDNESDANQLKDYCKMVDDDSDYSVRNQGNLKGWLHEN